MKRVSKMIHSSSFQRNKKPILNVLQRFIPKDESKFAIEIASGPGQHVVYFADSFPNIKWQPSDIDESYLKSISAFISDTGVKNVEQPLHIDVAIPADNWSGGKFKSASCDIVLNINMIHISPWSCTVGLFKSSGYLLKSGGLLFTYGPYAFHGNITPDSNIAFDKSLKSNNPEYGLRDIDDVTELAAKNGLNIKEIVEMPSNNKTLVFQKM